MPWKVADVDSKIKGLNPKQKASWVKIANSVLKSCKADGEKDCDTKAVRIANAKAKGTQSEVDAAIDDYAVVNYAYSLKVKEIKDLSAEQTDEGLLVKAIPVFKAGTYREIEYSEDYIDRNFIGQFNVDEDIPIQADHDSSTMATLGWVQKLTRKSAMMYADFLFIDENAIARWKKGLMKKFSIGVDLMRDKIREISVVAFPYVKSARVHNDDTIPEELNIEATEVNGQYFVTIEGEQYKAEKDSENLWFFFPIARRDKDGAVEQNEETNIIDEDVDNIDIKEDVVDDSDLDADSDEVKLSAKYRNSLPDSSFLLVRRPVRDKGKDRALPIKNVDGKVSHSHIKSALAKIDHLKGFSPEKISDVKPKLLRIAKKLGMEVESKEDKNTKDLQMKLDELKKLDLSKLEGQGSELLKEAVEHITALEAERDEAKLKSSEAAIENKKLSDAIKTSKIDVKLAELKAKGKITPAQEEATKAFMLTLEDKEIDAFVKILSEGKPVVDLKETGKETSEKAETKDLLDIDKLEATEINEVAEKLAKDNEVDFSVALDWCYDGKVSKEGKLLKK